MAILRYDFFSDAQFNLTALNLVSAILMVLWAILRICGLKKSVIAFVLAYGLLYADYLVTLQKHFNFELVGIMIAVAVVVGIVQFFRNHRKVQPSKELAIYLFLSVVHGLLYLLISL